MHITQLHIFCGLRAGNVISKLLTLCLLKRCPVEYGSIRQFKNSIGPLININYYRTILYSLNVLDIKTFVEG